MRSSLKVRNFLRVLFHLFLLFFAACYLRYAAIVLYVLELLFIGTPGDGAIQDLPNGMRDRFMNCFRDPTNENSGDDIFCYDTPQERMLAKRKLKVFQQPLADLQKLKTVIKKSCKPFKRKPAKDSIELAL